MATDSNNAKTAFWMLTLGLFLVLASVNGVLAQVPTPEVVDDADMRGLLVQPRWSPYLVGIAIGVLSWLTFLFSNKALGISTSYVRTFGMLEKVIRGKKVEQEPYFRRYAPKIDWQWMLVIGVFIGASLSARISGDFGWERVPTIWQERIGGGTLLRWLVALAGGIVMGIGARWAGGCTSGHGISGTLQLAVSSWLAAMCFFVGGIATAMLLFHILA
jgi:uncharacterized protein